MIKKSLFIALLLSSSVYAVDWSSYTISVNQHKIHYYQGGSGKPLFLLTGYATTSNFWSKPFVNCLAKDHTVYLVDYWGINIDETVPGNSSIQAMANDSYALSSALKVKKPVFIGWSMGGAVAQQISYSYGEDIGKVVLIAPLTMHNQPPAEAEDDDTIIRPLKTYNDVLNYVFDNNLYDYSPRQLRKYKGNLFAPDERLFPRGQISQNQSIAMNSWASNPQTLNEAQDSSSRYLVMVPEQDKMLSPARTLNDAKLLKNATVQKFDGSGHNISMQAPEVACSQIEGFL